MNNTFSAHILSTQQRGLTMKFTALTTSIVAVIGLSSTNIASAENPNLATGTSTLFIPTLNIDGVPQFNNVELEFNFETQQFRLKNWEEIPPLWSGSQIQFHVSADGTEITQTGSTLKFTTADDEEAEVALIFGPIDFYNVGSCSHFTMTLSLQKPISITDNRFIWYDHALILTGEFISSSQSKGTYFYSQFDEYCGATATAEGNWEALKSSTRKALRSRRSSGQLIEQFDPQTGITRVIEYHFE
jgi:hypothetical protein